jgi:hypothetical protein
MDINQRNRFFSAIGGRKQFNGYIATALLTIMAPFLGASFPEYSLGVLGALGLTSSLIAFGLSTTLCDKLAQRWLKSLILRSHIAFDHTK